MKLTFPLQLSLGLSAFSLTQLISFVGISFPGTRIGALLILGTCVLGLLLLGLHNSLGLWQQGHSDPFKIGMLPAWALIIGFAIAVTSGIWIGVA